MARKTDEYCMLCDSAPCVCKSAKVKVVKPKAEPKQAVPIDAPSALEDMAKDARRLLRTQPPPGAAGRELSTEESEMVDAIKTAVRHLGATFVDPEEERSYHAALAEPDSTRLRALSWKARVGRG